MLSGTHVVCSPEVVPVNPFGQQALQQGILVDASWVGLLVGLSAYLVCILLASSAAPLLLLLDSSPITHSSDRKMIFASSACLLGRKCPPPSTHGIAPVLIHCTQTLVLNCCISRYMQSTLNTTKRKLFFIVFFRSHLFVCFISFLFCFIYFIIITFFLFIYLLIYDMCRPEQGLLHWFIQTYILDDTTSHVI